MRSSPALSRNTNPAPTRPETRRLQLRGELLGTRACFREGHYSVRILQTGAIRRRTGLRIERRDESPGARGSQLSAP